MNSALAWAEYPDQDAHKLLSDNRELYIQQSMRTVGGRVAPFPRAVPPYSPTQAPGRAALLISEDSEA